MQEPVLNTSIKRWSHLVEGNPITYLPVETIPMMIEEVWGVSSMVRLSITGKLVKIGDQMLFEVYTVEYDKNRRR